MMATVDVSKLPTPTKKWCLGLPGWAKTATRQPPPGGVACLGYRVKAESITMAKKPTALDAGYEGLSYYWYPGGMTVPHSHGPTECTNGLEEIVAEPPPLGSIDPSIVRFRSKSI